MNTVDAAEIKQFQKDSDHWWDESGPFRALHQLNPVRLSYMRDQIIAHTATKNIDQKNIKILKNLDILDVGCGGGLICEPMARLGANVTGIDADSQAIEVAQDHAMKTNLSIQYHSISTEDLLQEKKLYDVVLALEIIEHVQDLDQFVDNCVDLCKPGGLLIFSTLNRTAKSFALGILAAEYILRWVPRGTHNWKKFIRPSELARALRHRHTQVHNITGLIFDPLKGGFRLSKRDLDVNYLMSAQKTERGN